ncbi:MAG TPA: pitrilysin family protein [Planctomycetaceae bacterium]|nr:pitrilysin family protein [Planctomycetaceae bacterium]
MQFHHAQLSNGLTVIAELNPQVHSVALGFFVRAGARDESPENSGVSHFLEHMAFKGNERYSADELNRTFDEIGADYNASTSEEVTIFHAAVLPEYLPRGFELVSCLLYPSVRQEDFDVEKKVILEEIGMYMDQPGWVAYEKAMQTHFAGHPLERIVLGTTESITALSSEQMCRYHEERYRAGNITLAVAGNTSWDQVLDLARQHCNAWPAGRTARPDEEARPLGGQTIVPKPSSHLEHLVALSPAPPAESPLRFAAAILSVIVGDSSGSRLFWALVDPGLAESAGLGFNDYNGSGAWMSYLSCTPEATAANHALMNEIYEAVNSTGVTEEELRRAKSKVASRIVLRGERPRGRLSSLGENWVYRQEYRSIEADLKVVEEMTTADIRGLLEAYPLGQITTAAVGPLESLNGRP